MRIHHLTVESIRGIQNLNLALEGRNAVIAGANGTGKSGVVDALDFLLTGSITRLEGPGTGSLSLERHGRHIGASAESGRVTAEVSFDGLEGRFSISRHLSKPGELERPAEIAELMRNVETIARNGQHALTRRDLLKFISAQPSERARQVEGLLKLEDIEQLRAILRRAMAALRDAADAARQAVSQYESTVATSAQITSGFDPIILTEKANEWRAILGVKPIDVLQTGGLLDGVQRPPVSRSSTGQVIARADVTTLEQIVSSGASETLRTNDAVLRERLVSVQQSPELRELVQLARLFEMGLENLDSSGACPLCDTPFDSGALRAHIEQKLQRAVEARQLLRELDTSAQVCVRETGVLLSAIGNLLSGATPYPPQERTALTDWQRSVTVYRNECEKASREFTSLSTPPEALDTYFAGFDVPPFLASISRHFDAVEPLDRNQLALDLLTRLDENLKNLQERRQASTAADLARVRSEVLYQTFLDSRDAILSDLYEEVADRFVSFYKLLHAHESATFTAQITSTQAGAGINLGVQFLNQGMFPPNAVHSEGHQDSMGLCLFLALAERVSTRVLDVVILDDVIMSVDKEHRKDICTLFQQEFSDRQFIITTHDMTWARQLRSYGVVPRENYIEFTNWSLEAGPSLGVYAGMWDRIQARLEESNVPGAAAELRRGSEEYFEEVCDRLQAPVRYRSDARWELGDWLPAAAEAYRGLLRRARSAAEAWRDQEVKDSLDELESIRKQILTRSKSEEWAVNPAVHYSKWADFTVSEFQEVVEAFEDLHALFACQRCGQLLRVAEVDHDVANVVCTCGEISWNLKHRS